MQKSLPFVNGRKDLPQQFQLWSYEPVQTDYETLKVVPPSGQTNKFYDKVTKAALKDIRDAMKADDGSGSE